MQTCMHSETGKVEAQNPANLLHNCPLSGSEVDNYKLLSYIRVQYERALPRGSEGRSRRRGGSNPTAVLF